MKKKENEFQEKKTQKQKQEKRASKKITKQEFSKVLKSQGLEIIGVSEKTSQRIETTQDIVPMEKSMGKVLKLKDGRYIGIIEILPINFSTKSHEGKLAVIQYYFEFLKIAPRKMQFFITTERTNATSLVDSLKAKNENESITLVKERREELIKHVETVSNQETLSRHFYIIYEYDATEDDEKDLQKSEDEIYKSMMKTRMRIEAFIGQCGNDIVRHKNEDLFASELLYKELNPRSSKEENFEKRIQRICTDHMLLNPKDYDFDKISEDNFLAPRGYNLEHNRYLIKDGMYESYLYVVSNGFPSGVPVGWFDLFCGFGENVTISLFAEKYNRLKAISQIAHSASLKDIKADEKNKRDERKDMWNQSINDEQMKDRMADNDEDLYDVTLLITVRNTSLRALKTHISEIKRTLTAKSIKTEDCTNHIEEAAQMSLPTLTIAPSIRKRGKRNFLTSSLASTYMYSAFEMFDDDGMVIGINNSDSTIVAPDFFNTERFPNPNIVIFGQSGMGKTYLLMLIAYSLRLQGKSVYLILPNKGYEWKILTQSIGGTFVDCAPASKDCINLMEIRPQKEMDDTLTDAADEGSLLSKKIHQIITFIQLDMTRGEMTDEEEASLSTVLTQLYYAFGITTDNESIWEDKENKIVKKMPIIEDLYKMALNDSILSERIVTILNPYVFGECKNMNGQTNVDLENKFVAISISRAGKKIGPFSFLATSTCYDRLKEDRIENCGLMMDEVWQMMVNEYASTYVMDIYKIIRGYGGAAISATQDTEDLRKSINGAGIINNAKTKIFLGMDENAIKAIDEILTLSEEDKQIIMRQGKGQALLVSGSEKIRVSVIAPSQWHHLFDTDAKSIRQYKEEQLKKKSQNS